MNPLLKDPITLIALIIWLATMSAASALTFLAYVLINIQPLQSPCESISATTQEPTVSDQTTEPRITRPAEEIKNDADLKDTLNELEALDVDNIDSLLEQNDLDAASF